MTEPKWIDVIVLGSDYEQAVSECGRYWRHRPLSHGKLAELTGQIDGDVPVVELPWRPGPAPD